MPPLLSALITRITDSLKKYLIQSRAFIEEELQFDQITINDYQVAGGIPAHIDSHRPFKSVFVSVSLLSGVGFQFEKQTLDSGSDKQHVYVPKNSLMVFSAEARYAWTHAISGRKLDILDQQMIWRERRISITIRKIN